MRVNHVGHHGSIAASSAPPSEREAGPGRPAHQAPSVPLQPLRRTAGAVASGLMGAVRQTSALGTAALLTVASEVLVPGAQALRSRQAPPAQAAPPRRLMESFPAPGTAGQRGPALAGAVLPMEPMAVAGAVVAAAVAAGAVAAAGVGAYRKWVADPPAAA